MAVVFFFDNLWQQLLTVGPKENEQRMWLANRLHHGKIYWKTKTLFITTFWEFRGFEWIWRAIFMRPFQCSCSNYQFIFFVIFFTYLMYFRFFLICWFYAVSFFLLFFSFLYIFYFMNPKIQGKSWTSPHFLIVKTAKIDIHAVVWSIQKNLFLKYKLLLLHFIY